MHKIISFILCLGLLTLSSCKDDSLEGFTIIRYGTSFGQCVGYCAKTLIMQEAVVTFEKASLTDKSGYPDASCDDNFPLFKDLKAEIDANAFLKLPAVIGCPDCADEGAEWVELESPDLVHRVTFEYNKAPEELEAYIDDLRFYIQRMEAVCP